MEKTVSSPKQWLREIDVVIEPEKLKARTDSLLAEYGGRALIPGFRPGHAPRHVVERRLGSQVESAAVEDLVEEAMREVLSDDSLHPVSQPHIDDLEVTPEKAIKLRLSFEVIPDFELKNYTGISLKAEEPSGFDAEFERLVQALREKCATFRPVARPAGDHDFVVADYRTFTGDTETGKPRTNVMLEVGDQLASEEVNRALAGARPGEERTASVPYPADYQNKELAGRTVTYRFQVRDVKERILPELSEEFAQDLGYESMDKLRIEINEEILADRHRLAENGLKNQIFDYLVAEHEFEPPESWVAASLERLARQYELPDDEETRQRLHPVAVKWAKFDCLVTRISAREDIKVTEDEIAAQVQSLAEEAKRPAGEVASLLDNPSYRNQLLREKVLRFIREKANVA